MSQFAKVLNGEVLEYRSEAPEGNQSHLAPGKPRWLPVEVTDVEADPVSQVRAGPVVTVLATKVKHVFSSRAKNADEIAAMIAEKDEALEAEFTRLTNEPISFAGHLWHADAGARENIMGIVLLIATGAPVPDPRPFTPHDQDEPVNLTHAQFVGLGAAIAARKDALFVIKKLRQAALAAMAAPLAIDAVDPTDGWDI